MVFEKNPKIWGGPPRKRLLESNFFEIRAKFAQAHHACANFCAKNIPIQAMLPPLIIKKGEEGENIGKQPSKVERRVVKA